MAEASRHDTAPTTHVLIHNTENADNHTEEKTDPSDLWSSEKDSGEEGI